MSDIESTIKTLRARRADLYEEISQIDATLNYLKKHCNHQWKYEGTGRHGSDKGINHYTCTICGEQDKR